MVKLHKHWIITKNNARNVWHPVSQKHRNIETQIRHDLKTGKLQRWAKRKGLYLTDSTYERYKREVLKRMI